MASCHCSLPGLANWEELLKWSANVGVAGSSEMSSRSAELVTSVTFGLFLASHAPVHVGIGWLLPYSLSDP